MVAADVNQALARVQSAAVRVSRPIARCARASSPSTGSVEGLKQTSRFGDVLVLISRPQEAVYALQLLKVAFDEYFSHGGRVQPGAVRAVPRAGLPRPGAHGAASPWRGYAR